MEKNNIKIVKFLNILFSVIFICVLLRLYNAVSIALTLTFIFIFIFWIRLLIKRFNKLDILIIFILLFSVLNVIINSYITHSIISFEYLKKLIMFLCSILYFSSLLKVQTNLHKYKNFICYINTILSITCILIYFINFNQVHTFNGILTNYLSFNFTNPNLAAMFLTVLCIFELNFLFIEKKKIKKIIYMFICLFLIYFILKTKARVCVLAVLSYILFLGINKFKNKIKISPFLLKIISILPFLFVFVYLKVLRNANILALFSFLSSEGKALSSRETIWLYAIAKFKESPIFGAYSQISNGLGSSQMHNSHLDILTSYGILVFVLFCILIYYILKFINKKSNTFIQFIYLFSFIIIFLCGISEATLFSASLGLNIYVGNFLLLASFDYKEDKKNENSIY